MKENWQVHLLKTDKGSEEIADFLKNKLDITLHDVKIEEFMEKEELEKIAEIIKNNNKNKILAIYGSGAWHHLAYGFFDAASKSTNCCYVHVDAHSDDCSCYQKINSRKINSRNFVNFIRSKVFVGNVFIGSDEKYKGYESITEKEIHRSIKNKTLEKLLKEKLPNNIYNNIYISLDLDIMSQNEIKTDFEYTCGSLKKKELLELLYYAKKLFNVIGADICGYAEQGIKEEKIKEKSLRLYYDLAKIIIS